MLEVTNVESNDHFQALTLQQKADDFAWRLISVYGPVKDNLKQDFLNDLNVLIKSVDIPTLIGGDFNLIRRREEKSSGNVNVHLMDTFNDFVANTELRELHRGGGQYTWSNKQVQPIMVVLDRVFMNASWEAHFPLVTTHSITRVGSNHNPLMVKTCIKRRVRSKKIRFESAWVKHEGFCEWVRSKWPDKLNFRSIDQ